MTHGVFSLLNILSREAEKDGVLLGTLTFFLAAPHGFLNDKWFVILLPFLQFQTFSLDALAFHQSCVLNHSLE